MTNATPARPEWKPLGSGYWLMGDEIYKGQGREAMMVGRMYQQEAEFAAAMNAPQHPRQAAGRSASEYHFGADTSGDSELWWVMPWTGIGNVVAEDDVVWFSTKVDAEAACQMMNKLGTQYGRALKAVREGIRAFCPPNDKEQVRNFMDEFDDVLTASCAEPINLEAHPESVPQDGKLNMLQINLSGAIAALEGYTSEDPDERLRKHYVANLRKTIMPFLQPTIAPQEPEARRDGVDAKLFRYSEAEVYAMEAAFKRAENRHGFYETLMAVVTAWRRLQPLNKCQQYYELLRECQAELRAYNATGMVETIEQALAATPPATGDEARLREALEEIMELCQTPHNADGSDIAAIFVTAKAAVSLSNKEKPEKIDPLDILIQQSENMTLEQVADKYISDVKMKLDKAALSTPPKGGR